MSTVKIEDCRGRLIHGLIPAVPVPFNSRGEIARDAQKCYASFLAQEPIAGVAVWAHTGRGLHLSPLQRLEVLESWAQALGAGSLIVAGVGGLREAQRPPRFRLVGHGPRRWRCGGRGRGHSRSTSGQQRCAGAIRQNAQRAAAIQLDYHAVPHREFIYDPV